MSKIKKMVGETSMALDTLRCNHLAPLGFKGLPTDVTDAWNKVGAARQQSYTLC